MARSIRRQAERSRAQASGAPASAAEGAGRWTGGSDSIKSAPRWRPSRSRTPVAQLCGAAALRAVHHERLDRGADGYHVFTTFEGAFILARATDDPTCLRSQLVHLRRHLQLLIGVAERPVRGD